MARKIAHRASIALYFDEPPPPFHPLQPTLTYPDLKCNLFHKYALNFTYLIQFNPEFHNLEICFTAKHQF